MSEMFKCANCFFETRNLGAAKSHAISNGHIFAKALPIGDSRPTASETSETAKDGAGSRVAMLEAAHKAVGELSYTMAEWLRSMDEPDWYEEVTAANGLPSVERWRKLTQAFHSATRADHQEDTTATPVAQEDAGGSRGGDKRFTTGTLSGDLRELAKLIRDQTEQDWIGVTESNSVNETLESAQAWRHNCRAYAEGVEQAAGYIEDDGLAEAGRSVIADRLAEQLANGVPPEEIEWPEAWANLAREIKKYGGGSRD